MRRGQWLTWAREAAGLYRRRRLGPRGILNHTFGPWLPRSFQAAAARVFGRTISYLPMYSALHPAIAADRGYSRHLRSLDFDPTFRSHPSIRHLALFALLRVGALGQAIKGTLAENGIAWCDPTADQRLIEFSLSLPERMWLRDGETKWLYRQVFRGRVPDAVMDLKHRGYQGADWPERYQRSKARIDQEITAALADPAVSSLIDTAFLKSIKDMALPVSLATAAHRNTYRFKSLRSLSVAHFIRNSRRTNAPPPD